MRSVLVLGVLGLVHAASARAPATRPKIGRAKVAPAAAAAADVAALAAAADLAAAPPRSAAAAALAARGGGGGAGATRVSAAQAALFALTYVGYCLIYFVRKPVSLTKATIEAELGIPKSQIGLIETSFLAAYAAGQLAIGALTRRFSERALLLAAFAGCGGLTMAFGACSVSYTHLTLPTKA